jgi:hypothetical protein
MERLNREKLFTLLNSRNTEKELTNALKALYKDPFAAINQERNTPMKN